MREIFPVGFEPRELEGQQLVDFDAALFRDGEHRVGLVGALASIVWQDRIVRYGVATQSGEVQRLYMSMHSGQKWEMLEVQAIVSRIVPISCLNIINADVLAPDDLWAFIFFLAGFSSGNIWFVLSPKDEVIAALRASTQAQRAPRLLAIMLHKLGVE